MWHANRCFRSTSGRRTPIVKKSDGRQLAGARDAVRTQARANWITRAGDKEPDETTCGQVKVFSQLRVDCLSLERAHAHAHAPFFINGTWIHFGHKQRPYCLLALAPRPECKFGRFQRHLAGQKPFTCLAKSSGEFGCSLKATKAGAHVCALNVKPHDS